MDKRSGKPPTAATVPVSVTIPASSASTTFTVTPIDDSAGANPQQSRLFFHRPLADGETLSYEFYYEPGAVMAHPAGLAELEVICTTGQPCATVYQSTVYTAGPK